jgi:hypothetical protein
MKPPTQRQRPKPRHRTLEEWKSRRHHGRTTVFAALLNQSAMPRPVQTNASDDTFPFFFEIWSISVPNRYPPLYHYTHQHTIQSLLQSGELWGRPTWDFPDTEEYVYGLSVLKEQFEEFRKSATRDDDVLAAAIREAYGDMAPPFATLIDKVIDNLQHEITNYQSPSVKVYVASLTTDAHSTEMKKDYGDCVVGFSFELPWVAYHAPTPFTSTMLSRVTYDEQEFRLVAPSLALHPQVSEMPDIERRLVWLRDQADVDSRTTAFAGWITEELCLVAPNLKRPIFAIEKEWRLKSAISSYATSPHFPRRALQSQSPHLPSTAMFLDEERSRYLQKLTSVDDERMIVSSVDGCDRSNRQWIREWRRCNQSPWLRPSSMLKPGSAGIAALLQAPAPFKNLAKPGALGPLPPQLAEFRRRLRRGPPDWEPPRPFDMNFMQFLKVAAKQGAVDSKY